MRKNKLSASALPDPVPTALYGILCGISLVCVLLIIVREVRMGDLSFRFLLWNLFLAWLPMIVSMAALRAGRMKRGAARALLLAVLAAGWLLLYPNAPYLTTDFIHLIFRFYDRDSLLLWHDLVVFFLFAWCGLLLGASSMLHFHAMVRKGLGAFMGWIFVAAVSCLGGFGIYLGRVVRLNSWDAIFSPFRLMEGVLEGLNAWAFLFSAMFGALILICYVTMYTLWSGGKAAQSQL